MGLVIGWGGDLERGAAMMEKAIVMNPRNPPWYHYLLSHYYILKEDYETALNHALRLTWKWNWDYMYRTTIYARSGRMVEARAEAAKLLEAYPTYPVEVRAELERYNMPDQVIREYLRTLREAGIDVPEERPVTN
jgi:tetratricopeptide (TPR) repeat protein